MGGDVWRDRYAVRAKFGYMAQKFSLYPDLTVLENMRFFAGAYGVPPAPTGAPDQDAPRARWTCRETRHGRRQSLRRDAAIARARLRAGA